MFYLFIALSIVIGYFLGSINSAVILSRLFYKEDIREKGSKNAGLTNMLRVYGAKAAAFTFIGDFYAQRAFKIYNFQRYGRHEHFVGARRYF